MGVEADVEIVRTLREGAAIDSTYVLAQKLGLAHQDVVGAVMSMSSDDVQCIAKSEPKKLAIFSLTAEGKRFLENGLPEEHVLRILREGPAEGLTKEELAAKAADVDIGLKQLLSAKMVVRDKASGKHTLQPAAEGWTPPGKQDLETIANESADHKEKEEASKRLGKRKLSAASSVAFFAVTQGPSFPKTDDEFAKRSWRVKKAADFTAAQLREMWQTGDLVAMKKPNLSSLGVLPDQGNLHPLMKLRQQYREIFLELGFQEMDTARFVDSCFWNFDTLFVPQQHPARDAQDTFFMQEPPSSTNHPEQYLRDTEAVHKDGLYGSTGYKYNWSQSETERLVLRTHTTAISSYTLYQIGQEYQRTGKLQTGAYFSIDRVFRNEKPDKTHLCEFHQMEGFVLDYDLSLSNMMSLLRSFFERVGVTNLMFKPAYNPYTEPSMEVHTEQNGKIMEVGNSGVFRPEMLRPMGLPEGVTAIAWGLGLERVAMRHYKLPSVQDLFGHRVSLPFVKSAEAPRPRV